VSYPEPVYHSDKGEVSAIYVPSDKPVDLTMGGGTQIRYLATNASTSGRLGLYRVDMGPEPSGVGPHFHRPAAPAVEGSTPDPLPPDTAAAHDPAQAGAGG